MLSSAGRRGAAAAGDLAALNARAVPPAALLAASTATGAAGGRAERWAVEAAALSTIEAEDIRASRVFQGGLETARKGDAA